MVGDRGGEIGDHLVVEDVEAGALGVGGGRLEAVEERVDGLERLVVQRTLRAGVRIELAEDLGAEAIEDLVEGDLDGVGVLERGEAVVEGTVVVAVVVVAEDAAAESGGAAEASVGLDVAAARGGVGVGEVLVAGADFSQLDGAEALSWCHDGYSSPSPSGLVESKT